MLWLPPEYSDAPSFATHATVLGPFVMGKKSRFHHGALSILGLLTMAGVCAQWQSFSQSYNLLTTVAGQGGNCSSDVNGWLKEYEAISAVRADLSSPHMAMADSMGNIYIADKDTHAIRKIDVKGIITTIAGTSAMGDGQDGPANARALYSPNGVWVNKKGEFYILDLMNYKIKKVDTAGNMTTVIHDTAGIFTGRGLWVSQNEDTIWYASGSEIKMWTKAGGMVIYASGFSGLGNIVQDRNGCIVATDRPANAVYRIDGQGNKAKIAGNDETTGGGDGFPALQTAFYGVRGVWFLKDNTYFLGTHEGSQVWYIDSGGIAHLFLEGRSGDKNHSGDNENYRTPGYKISEVRSVTVDYQGNVIVAENDCGYIRRIEKRNAGVANGCVTPHGISILAFSNPLSGSIRFTVTLSFPGKTRVRIYNQRGQMVDVPMPSTRATAGREIHWQSRRLPCGVYSVILRSGKFSVSQKCVLLY